MTTYAGHALSLVNISKKYGDVTVVRDVSLEVASGRFLTLLGPSGSGKTSILMMIAGFSAPDAGLIRLDGADITAQPPEKRAFGMVFQGYALFPHMSAAENVDFPLRVRKIPKAERAARVRAALDLVQLSQFGDRRPGQLSGGQQQRIALARALVFDPAILLLDEPLSALDRKLRAELQEELKAIHQRIGRTFIYVTHDQEEALSLSDDIAIMNAGRIVQFGAPNTLYEKPATRFVANFLGHSNFIEGDIESRDESGFTVVSGSLRARALGQPPQGKALLSLRPEKIGILPQQAGENTARGFIASWAYVGTGYSLVVRIKGFGDLRVNVPAWHAPIVPKTGAEIAIGWAPEAVVPVARDAA
jgi:putative spermidine/putrescine transport system ATP-binding protein